MQHQPGVLQPPLQHKRPRAPGLVAQADAFGLGMLTVHHSTVDRRQQSQERGIRMTQLDFHRVDVHGADAIGDDRIQNPPPRRHDRWVAQAFQGEDHVRRLDRPS